MKNNIVGFRLVVPEGTITANPILQVGVMGWADSQVGTIWHTVQIIAVPKEDFEAYSRQLHEVEGG